jgi:hypothetical protein
MSEFKDPKGRICLVFLRNKEEVSVTGDPNRKQDRNDEQGLN